MNTSGNKISLLVMCGCLFLTIFLTLFIFKPTIDPQGDGPSYVQAMQVLEGQTPGSGFMPNRILTTFGSLESVIFLSNVSGGLTYGWFILNSLFFLILGITFYKLILLLFESEKVALLAGLFLCTNYAVLSFGLGYYMDIGGWMFYVLSLYFLLVYSKSGRMRDLLFSALSISIGGLFKEYAFLGCFGILFFLAIDQWRTPLRLLKNGAISACIALVPFGIVSFFVLQRFGYTYLDWFSLVNGEYGYAYASPILEYIKSLGSLYNLLAFLVLGGLCVFLRQGKQILPVRSDRVFIVSAVLSALPVFLWPAITQRILFVTVPAAIMVACFLFKKYESKIYLFLPVLGLYAVASFIMNTILLPRINLPF